MAASRTATAVVGLVASLAISIAVYVATGWLFLFVFVPFVPFLFARPLGGDGPDRPPPRECPQCGFRTRDPDFEYCPRDGRSLRESPRRRA
jgi:hypothetical protein